MPTHCSATGMAFGRVGGRDVVAEFDGGRVTSLRALLSRTEYGYNDPLGLGRVDGFDDDKAQSECDEGSEVLVRFLAAERNSLEALELAHKLLDAGTGSIECLREESRPV